MGDRCTCVRSSVWTLIWDRPSIYSRYWADTDVKRIKPSYTSSFDTSSCMLMIRPFHLAIVRATGLAYTHSRTRSQRATNRVPPLQKLCADDDKDPRMIKLYHDDRQRNTTRKRWIIAGAIDTCMTSDSRQQWDSDVHCLGKHRSINSINQSITITGLIYDAIKTLPVTATIQVNVNSKSSRGLHATKTDRVLRAVADPSLNHQCITFRQPWYSHGQPKNRWKRCPFSRRKNWGCHDVSLTTDGKLFQTVWGEDAESPSCGCWFGRGNGE